jgi:hypothetical protein
MTNRGGWHMGNALVRARGGADRVVGAIEDGARHMSKMCGNTHVVLYSRRFGGWASENHLVLRMVSLAEFGPENSTVTNPVGIEGGTRHHREGWVKTKQLRVERMAVRSKSQELVHFAPLSE